VRGARRRTTRHTGTGKPQSDPDYNCGRSTNQVGRSVNTRSRARARSVTTVSEDDINTSDDNIDTSDDDIDASDNDIKVSELRHMHSEMVEAGASKWATLSVDGSSSGNILSLSDIGLVLTSGFRNPLS
jgi:hypothetical protein